MKETTVLILLDAFRWDYVTEFDTPTLWAMAQEGIYAKKLRTSFGFCERSEIFTGTYPDVNGNFTAITYDANNSYFAKFGARLSLLSVFDRFKFTRKVVRTALSKYFRKRGIKQPIYEIPLKLLPMFSLTEDLLIHIQPNAFQVESVFDIMLQENKRFYYNSFTALGMGSGTDEDRSQRVYNHIADEYDLYLIYIGALDFAGHYYGTSSDERYTATRKVDEIIKQVRSKFLEYYDVVNFIVFGDHGMMDVVAQINVWDEIDTTAKKHGLKNGKDFLVFLDSTMLRFWFLQKTARQPFSLMFETNHFSKYGQLISEAFGKKYCIPAPSPRYGELIWWANPGVLIYPDYFHHFKPVKGMHGYAPDIDEMKGFAIVSSNNIESKIIDEVELVDICPTLCDLLKIRYPKTTQGNSLLNDKKKE